ncbi:hypothetical protein, partial [Saccharicrinis sp. GN24d3]|uniref:hypothetical protein n=1 Tax=Saccharicrinis sp. GN24d3 TaxID=3458416 RepID=UPI004034F960
MRKIYLTLFILFVWNLLGVSSVLFAQTDEDLKTYSKAQSEFYKDALEKGFPSLKGGNGNNPNIASSYCSEEGQVNITPTSWHDDAASIVWQIRTVLGSVEYHADWADVSGSGTSTVLEFHTDRVDPKYYGARIYFDYYQYDAGYTPLSIGSDYTILNQTPTVFELTSEDPFVCPGDPVILTLGNSELGIDYQLKDSDGNDVGFLINGSGSSIDFTVNPGTNTTYYVDAVNAADNSCNKNMNGNILVTVHDNPVINSISPNSEICYGEKTTLSATTDMDPNVDYLWDDGAGNTSSAASWDVSPVVTTTYNLTITNSITSCSVTTSVTVTVNSNPSITANSNSPVCQGSDINVGSTPSGGSGTYTTFSWSGPNGYSVDSQNAVIANAVEVNEGDYYITVTDNKGCSSDGTTFETVVVNERPTVTVNYNAPVCEGT